MITKAVQILVKHIRLLDCIFAILDVGKIFSVLSGFLGSVSITCKVLQV